MLRLSLPRLDERGRRVDAEVERGVGGRDILAGNVVTMVGEQSYRRMGVRGSTEPVAAPTSLRLRSTLARIADIRMTFVALCCS